MKRFRQSVLAAACSGQLTADWREANGGEDAVEFIADVAARRALACDSATRLDRTRWVPKWPRQTEEDQPADMSQLPLGWVRARLDTLFWVETGATPLRKNLAYYANGHVPWVRTGEIRNCDIESAQESITELALQETNTKILPAGTILIAMYGEGRTRGQVGVLKIEAATNQASAALVNPWLDDATRDYFYLFCLSQYHVLRRQAVGGNQPNLSVGLIKHWMVNVPPLAEQHEIVRRVEALFALADAIESRVAAATHRADRLTQSILAKAFRGELVTTEAELARREGRSYEPASELLARIKAERETSTPQKRTGARKRHSAGASDAARS